MQMSKPGQDVRAKPAHLVQVARLPQLALLEVLQMLLPARPGPITPQATPK